MAEGVQRQEGPSPKRWNLRTILSPSIRYFVAILRFVAIYALFGNIWVKSNDFLIVFTWHVLHVILS